jgi:nanoRNase/pAp phosphatase (c-di-AMP/oligoRNAs hydrolase)
MGRAASYAILGAGHLGFAIAQALRDAGRRVVLLDREPEKVESFRDAGFEAFEADYSQPGFLERLGAGDWKAVLITGRDPESNLFAWNEIRRQMPEALVYIRAVGDGRELRDLGIERAQILDPDEETAARVAAMLSERERASRAQELVTILERMGEGSRLGIVIQDSPDPDAIASAMALQQIAARCNVVAEILHGGGLGHQSNRAMVNLLDIKLLRCEAAEISAYSHLALVDVGVPGENNCLATGTPLEIVIDHHETNQNKVTARFVDLRPDFGATATIMVEYLNQLGIEISTQLATALLHGIRTDTNEFRRNATPSDLRAAAELYPLVDQQLLRQIESPARSMETVDVLGRAIETKRIKGSVLLADGGEITDKDALAQAADYLITLEGIATAIVYGIGQQHLFISARNADVRVHIGKLLEDAFSDVGSAGGHRTMGGAQIPLGLFSGVLDRQTLRELAKQAVTERIYQAMGL